MANGKIEIPHHPPAETFLILRGIEPGFDEERVEVSPGLTVEKVNPDLAPTLEQRGLQDAAELFGENQLLIRSRGNSSTSDILRADSLAVGLLLATDACIISEATIISDLPEGNPRAVTSGTRNSEAMIAPWGHFRNELTLEDIAAAKLLEPGISKLNVTDEFNRVGNALLFYRNGYRTDNPDLALVAFTTCLEGLYSTVSQEISFRLSLRLAGFLGTPDNRRGYYEDCHEIYKIRSKVVHGSSISKNNEAAAIYLTESVVPRAERLARESLLKLFQLQLQPVFENPARINSLFEDLLFSDSLEDTLHRMGLRLPPT